MSTNDNCITYIKLNAYIRILPIIFFYRPKGLKLENAYLRNPISKTAQLKNPPQNGPQNSQSGIVIVSASRLIISVFQFISPDNQ